MFGSFGNKVKIISSPETVEKELAGKIGEIYGETTPSKMELEVIGKLNEDYAVNVHFEELGESFWFAEELLEFLDNGQGTVFTIDGVDKKWIKGSKGEWTEEDTLESKKQWWEFWKK